MSAASLRALRKIALRPQVEEGTVVCFKVTHGDWLPSEVAVGGIRGPHRTYNFVAVLLGDSWYSTAQTANGLENGAYVLPKMSQVGFAGVLQSPQVTDIQVATSWESL